MILAARTRWLHCSTYHGRAVEDWYRRDVPAIPQKHWPVLMKMGVSLSDLAGIKDESTLIACEYSGRVRDAFLANGHDAMSCDLLPTEVPGPPTIRVTFMTCLMNSGI